MVDLRSTIEPALTISRGDTPRRLLSTTLNLVTDDDVQGG